MANKIDTVMDNLQAELDELVVAGTLKSVTRAVLEPAAVHDPPALGLVVSRIHREDETWFADVGIFLVANRGGLTVDEAVTELVGLIDGKITEAVDGSALGGHVNRPDWNFWYMPTGQSTGWQHVGAVGTCQMRVLDPLIIAE